MPPRRGGDVEVVNLNELASKARDGRKFTKEEREDIRTRTAAMRLQGYSFRDIADKLKISPSTAYEEYKVVEHRWRVTAFHAINELKSRELARLDVIESEAWDAWRRSQQDATELTQDYSGSGDARTLMGTKAKKTGRDGDARFLKIVVDCIDRRIKILGLEEDTRGAIPSGDKANSDSTIADRLARYQDILGFVIVAGENGPADSARLGESVDSARPAPETGRIFDVDGRLRESTP